MVSSSRLNRSSSRLTPPRGMQWHKAQTVERQCNRGLELKESDVGVGPTSAADAWELVAPPSLAIRGITAVAARAAPTFEQVEVGWRERTEALLAEIQLLGCRWFLRHG